MSKNNDQSNYWKLILLVIILLLAAFFTSKEKNETEKENNEDKARKEEEERKKREHEDNLKKLQVVEGLKSAKTQSKNLIVELINSKTAIKQRADKRYKRVFVGVRIVIVLFVLILNYSYLYGTDSFTKPEIDTIVNRTLVCNGALLLLLSGINFIYRGSIFSPKTALVNVRMYLKKKIYGEFLMIDDEIKSHQEQFILLEEEMKKLDVEELQLRGKINSFKMEIK